MAEQATDPLGEHDNIVAGFQVEGRAVRGRVIRLGDTINTILQGHDYPEPVARLLGELVLVATLVGDAMKFDGRLIVQATGKGPVAFIVAEYMTRGSVRATAKVDQDACAAALEQRQDGESWISTLLGEGMLVLTIDQGADMDRYQGVVPLEGETLAACAEAYFHQSEQTPTRLRVAVGEEWDAHGKRWRAGGALLQAVAGDEARGSAEDDWEHSRILFDTLEDAELLDTDLSAGALLYRLFNEDGVRVFEPSPVEARCTCERERLKHVVSRFSEDDIDHMLVDGEIVLSCDYCRAEYRFTRAEIDALKASD